MKKIFPLLSIIFICSSCGLLLKKAMRLHNPEVQTKESVTAYLEKINSPFSYSYILNDPGSEDAIEEAFFGAMENKKGILIDRNYNQYCYTGTTKCTGVQIRQSFNDLENNYEICKKYPFDSLVEKLDPLSGSYGMEKIDSDYYYIVNWAIYLGTEKTNEEDFQWLKELEKNANKNIQIILVNTDLQSSWGLEEGKKVRVHFKKIKDSEGGFEMIYSDLPYQTEGDS